MKKKTTKNKIANEFAIGIILLTALVVGGIFWAKNRKEVLESQYGIKVGISSQIQSESKKRTENVSRDRIKDTVKEISDCLPHYYEGEATIRGWLIPGENNQNVTMRVKNEDINKLPTSESDLTNPNFIVTLIDPTDKVREELLIATEAKPAEITLRGFARNCRSWPQVSLKQATIAFKKS